MGERPIRVVHLDTERGWRGGERQTFWLARELRAQHHGSIVAARPREALAAASQRDGLPVWAVEPLVELDPLAAFRLRSALRRHRTDILHAHTAHAVGLGALAVAGGSTALVVTRRVDFPLRRNPATRWKYARARALIAISSAVRDVLLAGGIPAERVTVVRSGVDLSRRVEPASQDTLRALGLAPGVPLVVMVAALVPHKAPVTFVRAIASAVGSGTRLQALLVGDGPLRGEVLRERDALGIETTLRVAGQRPDADGLIAAADVVALSSREEGLGTVLLDAMACGKAVAATAAGGIPDVVVDGETGLLVPVGDAAALGAAVGRLCTDEPLRASLGAAARDRARLFSIEQTAARTLEVYRRVLGDR